ncbi:MAG: hypothetical protein Q8R53_03415, partial [Nanoarchaeota archaeon]|nr:hypothetical protein [Nanoarchaeota archaeon]
IIRIEDKQEFLRRMHETVLARIALKQGKQKLKQEQEFSYQRFWEELQKKRDDEKDLLQENLKMEIWALKDVPVYVKEELVRFITDGNMRKDVLEQLRKDEGMMQSWTEELRAFVKMKIEEVV